MDKKQTQIKMHTSITPRRAVVSPPVKERRPWSAGAWGVVLLAVLAVLVVLSLLYSAQNKKTYIDMYRTHSCHTPVTPQMRVDSDQWSSISHMEATIAQLRAHQQELTTEVSRLHEEQRLGMAQLDLVQITLGKEIVLTGDRAFAGEHEMTGRMDVLEEMMTRLEEKITGLQTPRSRKLKDLHVSPPPELQLPSAPSAPSPPRKYLSADGLIKNGNQL